MKKKNVLGLGLGLLILTSPINPIEKNYENIAFAEEISESEEITYESFIKEIEIFKNSEVYKKLDEKVKNEFDTLISHLSEENFDQEYYDKISGKISEINLEKARNAYKLLYDEVKAMNKENLSDDLRDSFNELKESYDNVEEYNFNYDNLITLKEKINTYNDKLSYKRNLLKEGLEKNKYLNLADEKKVLEDQNSNLLSFDNAIKSINKKVDDFNKVQKKKEKEEKEKLAKEIDDAIKKYEEVKKDIVYRKSSKEAKGQLEKVFNELVESQKSLKEGKNEDFRKVLDKYNELVYNLDGHKFVVKLNELIDYFNENKEKINDEEKRSNFYKELNSVIDDDSFDKKSLDDLDKRIKDEVKKPAENSGQLTKLSRLKATKNDDKNDNSKKTTKKVAISKSKNPVKKKSRSFVRTGVGSVAIVSGVLVIAAGGYLYSKKKK